MTEFKLTRGERRILRRRRKIMPSAWAEQYRILTMSSLPGPWHNHVTPYLVGVMDAIWHRAVDTVILCKAPQTGGTECVYNAIGYSADCDPGPVLVVMPDEITARDNSRDRIQPMFLSSPRLQKYLTNSRDDMSGMRINLTHMPIYMAWSRSPARLANKPIRMVVFDETDKYPDFSNQREADPISLGTKRTITYRRTRKIIKISTPTIEAGLIWQALKNEAQSVYDWVSVCPDCHTEQVMVFENIVWGASRDAEEVQHYLLARYKCRECGSMWDDGTRDIAVRAGCWRHRIDTQKDAKDSEHGQELMVHLEKQRPSKIGFHIPSWLSHFVSLSDAAAAFLRGLKDKTKLRDFKNNHEARPWVFHQHERREDVILALRDDRPEGLVPAGGIVAGLTVGIDTQDNGFWYEVRAWGFGLNMDSWQVRFGFVSSFQELNQVLFGSEYADADGVQYQIEFGLMDSGGHRTVEVYEYCRGAHPCKIMPSKGQGRIATLFTTSKLDVYPGSGRPIPGGIWLLNINVNQYKDALDARLKIPLFESGAWALCADCDADWARQMTVEVIDEKTGLWINPRQSPNHGWDCSVLNLVAADFRKIRFRSGKTAQRTITQPQAVTTVVQSMPLWLQRRGGKWINR